VVVWVPWVVAYVREPANTREGLPRGHLSGRETLRSTQRRVIKARSFRWYRLATRKGRGGAIGHGVQCGLSCDILDV